MKRCMSICLTLMMCIFMLTLFQGFAYTASDPAIKFADKKLENAAVNALKYQGITVKGKITKSVALKLKLLKISDIPISDLEGIQYFTNIEVLSICNSKIKDISKLTNLKKLITLELRGNQIADIKVLSGMNELVAIDISNNRITDLSPLKKLKKLNSIKINGNSIRGAANLLITMPSLQLIDQYNMQWMKKDAENFMAFEEPVNKVLSLITPGMGDIEKERVINDYIVDNTTYVAGADTNYTAFGVLINGEAACNGFAEAANILLNLAGIESHIVIGKANNGSGIWGDHAWNIVKINGNYYHLDVTWNDAKAALSEKKHAVPNRLKYRYFNMTDEEMSKDHMWDKSREPVCTYKSGFYGIHDYTAGNYIIYFDNNYVYYTNYKLFDNINDTIFRKKIDGTSEAEVVAALDCTAEITKCYGEWIYITQLSRNFSVKKVKLDGSQIINIMSFETDDLMNGVVDFHVKDGYIYLIRYNRITRLSEDGSSVKDILTSSPGREIRSDERLEGDWIYYSVTGDDGFYGSYRISLDGARIEEVPIY